MKLLRDIICGVSGIILFSSAALWDGVSRKEARQQRELQQQRTFNYFFQEALRYKALGKQDEAFDLFQKALRTDSTSAVVQYEMGNYYLQLQKPLVALSYFEHAAQTDTTNYWFSTMYARLLQALNKSDQAVTIFQRLSRQYPSKRDVDFSLAEVYTQLGQNQEAIDALNRLQANVGINEFVTQEKHKLYLAQKDTLGAFAEIQQLVDANPNQPSYHILMGDRYLELGMLPQADSLYTLLEQRYQKNPYLLLSRANYYNQIGNLSASDSLIQRALVMEELEAGMKAELLEDYLIALFQKKESTESIDDLFKTVISQHPNEGELNTLYAKFLVTVDRNEEAVEQFGYAIDKAPANKELWMSQMSIYFEMKAYDTLLERLALAKENFPNDMSILELEAFTYTMLGAYQDALDAVREAIAKTPAQQVNNLASLWGMMGDMYYRLKQYDEAFAAFDRSLEYNPNSALVLNNYSYYLTLLDRDLTKAERLSGKAVKLEPKNPSYLDTYAWVFFKLKDYMFAKFYIEQAIRNMDQPSFEVYDHYGDILYLDGQKEEAVKQWEKALEALENENPGDNEPEKIETTKKKIKSKQYFSK